MHSRLWCLGVYAVCAPNPIRVNPVEFIGAAVTQLFFYYGVFVGWQISDSANVTDRSIAPRPDLRWPGERLHQIDSYS